MKNLFIRILESAMYENTIFKISKIAITLIICFIIYEFNLIDELFNFIDKF